MVRNNFMMHICTVATLCFPEKTVPRNYYYCVQDDNSLSLCFKSMYRTLFVAIFTSNFIFSMFKSFHTYRNINISNQQIQKPHKLMSHDIMNFYLKTLCMRLLSICHKQNGGISRCATSTSTVSTRRSSATG